MADPVLSASPDLILQISRKAGLPFSLLCRRHKSSTRSSPKQPVLGAELVSVAV